MLLPKKIKLPITKSKIIYKAILLNPHKNNVNEIMKFDLKCRTLDATTITDWQVQSPSILKRRKMKFFN